MRFLHPEYIYLMLVPAFVLVYLISTNKDTLERLFDAAVLDRLRIRGDALGRSGHNTLLFFVFFMMTLALAQPVIEKGQRPVALPGLDIAVGVDDSAAMGREEPPPGRMELAKMKVARLISRIEGVPIALYTFDRGADLVAPPTLDRETVQDLLHRLKVQQDKTGDLDAAIRGGLKLLRGQRYKLLLIVTAGEGVKEPTRLAQTVKRAEVRVVIWNMEGGTEKKMRRFAEDAAIVAQVSGGLYLPATADDADILELSRYLDQLLRHYPGGVEWLPRRIELFYIPLLLAFLALPFAIYSFGASGLEKWLVIPFLLILHPMEARAGLLDFMVLDKATKAYRNGDYNSAAAAFEKVAVHSPRPEIWYALGNSYYKAGRWKMACDAYGRVVTADPRLEAAKLYNLGNCYTKLGRYAKAAEFYRKVLKIWHDPDAVYNLEVVTAALKKERSVERLRSKKIRVAGPVKGASGSKREESETKGGARRGGVNLSISADESTYYECLKRMPLHLKLYPLLRPER